MSGHEFVAGDEVRCINAGVGAEEFLTFGHVYTIGAADEWGQYLIEGVGHSWHGSRFEPLPGSFDGVHPRLGAPEPEPTRPSHVCLIGKRWAGLANWAGEVHAVVDWQAGNPVVRPGSVEGYVIDAGEWEPAEAPEPTVTIEVPRSWAAYGASRKVGGFPSDDRVRAACRAALAARSDR